MSIKELVGGKSAQQNEIMGDIAKEFGQEPDNAADMPIETLGAALDVGYTQLGPVMLQMVTKMVCIHARACTHARTHSIAHARSLSCTPHMRAGTCAHARAHTFSHERTHTTHTCALGFVKDVSWVLTVRTPARPHARTARTARTACTRTPDADPRRAGTLTRQRTCLVS